jgi:glycerol-3-phosphate dehydrogenase
VSAGFDRATSLHRLGNERFDVLVVGGGITGCGVALDAAARGLHTALVTADDFASGTSSKSSKLIHGGLRYLAQGEYGLVYEALAERQRLLDNASHLVRPLPFLVPLFGRGGMASRSVAKAYSVALWSYDLTGGLRIGRRHRRVDAATVQGHFPDLRSDRLVGGFLYWDAQADDARLTLAVARTAALGHRAVVANHAPVARLLEEARSGRVVGAALVDGTEIRANVVVNAAGVWADAVNALGPAGGLRGRPNPSIRPAKGIHLTVTADRLPCSYAAVLPVPGEKRSIFVVPWVESGFTYVGTTDTDYDGPLDDPRCTPEDVDYLLTAVNAATTANLERSDITGAWAGLRPLASGAKDARTADLSRRHRVTTSSAGVVTVTGGKLTTYRRMAADTVDEVAGQLGRRLPRSQTRRLAIWGSEGAAEMGEPGAPRRLGVDAALAGHLAGRYGGEARAVAAMLSADPDLARPLVPGLPYVRAEAVFAARYEMATTLADVLDRRTRAMILDAAATARAAPGVAALLASELGWSPEEAALQAEAVVAAAEASMASVQATHASLR